MNKTYRIIDKFDLIGVPFDWGGRDHTKTLDCYGLVKFIHAQFGNELPDYKTPTPKESKALVAKNCGHKQYWKPTDEHDKEGNLAVFRTCSYLHVGYILGGGKFVHTWEKSGGVCIESLADWKTRIEGVYEFIGD